MASHPIPILLMATALFLAACSGSTPEPTSSTLTPSAAPSNAMEIVELKAGMGPAITNGQRAVVQYTGWLYDTAVVDKKGKQFDSSNNAGGPFKFVLGAGQVIKGWDQGVAGMKVAGSRRLTIPADLAYGDVGAGGVIPPGATLIFDVDLIAIE